MRTSIDPAQARAIAREAYIYGFPMVDNYRIQHAYFVNRGTTEFKAPFNEIRNLARVCTPDDRTVQTPNSDTPYSLLGVDLRAEPVVLTVPAIEKDRYFSIQFIDWYTHNFDYAGSRTTGNDGGNFLLAGPGWKGEVPKGVAKVFRSETDFVFAIYRTQLLNPADLDNVKAVQAGYKVQPLSAFVGESAPAAAAALDFIKPLTPHAQKTSLEFFRILNFVLRRCPTAPAEATLMERFATIGVGAGQAFDPDSLPAGLKQAIQQGIQDAWAEFADFKTTQLDTGKVTSGDLFGTRAHLNGNYLYRMAGAIMGIYGNSMAEAMYPMYRTDAAGAKLDAERKRYTLRFAPGELPPVHAFWSLTMYDLPASLLVPNRLDRYVLNSPMLGGLKREPDGGVTIHIQNESPGAESEANWLPAPKGAFWIAMRLYWPKDEVLSGKWIAPKLQEARR